MGDINVDTASLSAVASQVNAVYDSIATQLKGLNDKKAAIESCWNATEAQKCTAQLDKINAKFAKFDETYKVFMSSLDMINAYYDSSKNDLKRAILSIGSGGGN